MGKTLLYDPTVAEAGINNAIAAVDDADFKIMAEKANVFWRRIIDARRAQGVPEAELYNVAIIHRVRNERKTGRPMVRYINLSPKNPGRLNHCEEMLKGSWRLATAEEESADKKFQDGESIRQDQDELLRLQRERDRRDRSLLDASDRVEQRQIARIKEKKARGAVDEHPAAAVAEKPPAVVDEKTKRRV